MKGEKEEVVLKDTKKLKPNILINNISIKFILVLSAVFLGILFIGSFIVTVYFKNTNILEYNEGLMYRVDNPLINIFRTCYYVFDYIQSI